jgi:hypothetical protein
MRFKTIVVVLLLLTVGILGGATVPAVVVPTQGPPRLTTAGSSSGTWWVGASATTASALPNTGVSGTVQVISTPVSGCLTFWVSDDLEDNIWGQVGYYLYGSSTPVAFYEIWNLNTNTELFAATTSVTTGYHTFSMYLESGTTWAYALDGKVFGTYDMGASVSSSSYPVYALSEESYVSSPFSFPTTTFTTAMQVMQSGGWNYVQTGNSYGTAWGVQSNLQNQGLQNDEIALGWQAAPTSQGSTLWNGAPSPSPSPTLSTAITSPAAGSSVTGTVTVTSTSSASDGVAKVELYVDGALAGTSTSIQSSFQWNTGQYSSGAHSLYTEVYDIAGDTAVSSPTVSVTVLAAPTPTGPSVQITSPTKGSTVRGTVTIAATASDAKGISSIRFYADGVLIATGTGPASQATWNSQTATNGHHTITVTATDTLGLSTTASLSVKVSNR